MRILSAHLLRQLIIILLAGSLNQLWAAEPPYRPSPVITGITFDWSTLDTRAPGSDNWTITWADDNHQYTTWGDGGGFGGTNSDGRVSLGVARVEGDKHSYSGFNVWGGKNAKNSAQFSGKSYGIISIDGTLYMWQTGDHSEDSAFAIQQLHRSKNHGATWSSTGVKFKAKSFPNSKGFFAPTFLQFGKDYQGARDNYVYIYAPENKSDVWNVQKPGEITLIRVLKNNITKLSNYEYFAGVDNNNNPIWTSNIADREPVFSDSSNGVMRTSVSYNAGLDRYLLITQQVDRTKSGNGHIGIYDAPEPWGPWTTVLFENAWSIGLQTGSKTVQWNFSNKWLSADGKDFVLVYTGDGADEWGTVWGSFKTATSNTPDNQAPVLNSISNKSIIESELLDFTITADDPDATSPELSAAHLPDGASFIDNGDGTGTFNWIPPLGAAAASPYRVTFTATDATGRDLTDSKTITIEVHPADSQVWPTTGWLTASPAEMGMDQTKLEQARDYALTGGGSGLITRGGRVVMSWGDATQLYDVKSTTKSIGATALGLALQDAKVSLSDTAQQHLPDVGIPPQSNANTGWLDEITVQQLATHTAGFDKPAGYIDLLFEPGTTWAYSDGGANWLADLLTVIYGEDLDSFMSDRVFTPLGISSSDLTWRSHNYRDDRIDGIKRREFASGISTHVDALARIGYLYLRQGIWDDQSILSESFIYRARRPFPSVMGLPVQDSVSHPGASQHYGLLWWNNSDGTLSAVPRDAYWAWGLHDSLIVVIPSLDIVVARAGNGWRSGWNSDYSVLQPFLEPIARSVLQEPVNQPPVANDDAATVQAGGSVFIDVLVNDIDIEGTVGPNTVTVVSGPSGGSVAVDGVTGEITYTSNGEGDGNDSFTYTVMDNAGAVSNIATVRISIEPTGSVGSFLQDGSSQGLISIEAEHFDAIAPSSEGHEWEPVSMPGYSGSGALQVLPNDQTDWKGEGYVLSPRLDYRVKIVTAGTHYIWIRGLGPSTSSNSLHVGLDGELTATSSAISVEDTMGEWVWTNVQHGTFVVSTLEVASPGEHVINVWAREAGIAFDKLVLTTDPFFVPVGVGPDESPTGLFHQDGDLQGLVSIEAEQHHGQTPQGGHEWALVSDSSYSDNGAMQASPEDGTYRGPGYSSNSPQLDYQVEFVTTGTHYIWVRGMGPSSVSNSVHLGLDGGEVSSGAALAFSPGSGLVWSNSEHATGLVRTLEIPSKGFHTVNVWMRESGTIVDKIVLTTDASFIPEATGP